MGRKSKQTFNMKVSNITRTERETEDASNVGFKAELVNTDFNSDLKRITLIAEEEFDFNPKDIIAVIITEPDQKTLDEIVEKEKKKAEKEEKKVAE